MLTSKQLEILIALVNQRTNGLAVQLAGPTVITQQDLEELRLTGMIDPSATIPLIDNMFTLGRLRVILGDAFYHSLTFPDLVVLAQRYPLYDQEREILDQVRVSAMAELTQLKAQILSGAILAVDPSTPLDVVEDTIRRVVAADVVQRKTWKQTATNLGSTLGEWSRDWHRVAFTVSAHANNHGVAAAIAAKRGMYEKAPGSGFGANVYVRPVSGACPECRTAYLDKNGVPHVWTLAEMLARGTNIGVPKKLRKPVIPPHHPWCSCMLGFLPPGWGFDARGLPNLVDPIVAYGPRPVAS